MHFCETFPGLSTSSKEGPDAMRCDAISDASQYW